MVAAITNLLDANTKTICYLQKADLLEKIKFDKIPHISFDTKCGGKIEGATSPIIYHIETKNISDSYYSSLSKLAKKPIIGIFVGIIRSLISIVYLVISVWNRIFKNSSYFSENIKYGFYHLFKGVVEMIPIVGRFNTLRDYPKNEKTFDFCDNLKREFDKMPINTKLLLLFKNGNFVARKVFVSTIEARTFSELKNYIKNQTF